MSEILVYIEPDVLANTCHSSGTELIDRRLGDEEITQMKEQYYSLMLKIKTRTDAISLISTALKKMTQEVILEACDVLISQNFGEENVDQLSKQADALITCIEKGWMESKETVYRMIYEEIGRMAVYNSAGYFIYDRPLTPDEKQRELFSNPLIRII